MLVTMKRWNNIRYLFEQWEKDQLNAAISGETICPKGIVINEQVLPESINSKLKFALEQERKLT
jgi:hypothetical protein